MNKIAIAIVFSLATLPEAVHATGLENTVPPSLPIDTWHCDLEKNIPNLLPTSMQLLIPTSVENNAPSRKASPVENDSTASKTWFYPTRQPDTVIDTAPTPHY